MSVQTSTPVHITVKQNTRSCSLRAGSSEFQILSTFSSRERSGVYQVKKIPLTEAPALGYIAETTHLNRELRGSLTFSLNFLSRRSATISAALPRGQRMMGTEPTGVSHIYIEQGSLYRDHCTYIFCRDYVER